MLLDCDVKLHYNQPSPMRTDGLSEVDVLILYHLQYLFNVNSIKKNIKPYYLPDTKTLILKLMTYQITFILRKHILCYFHL